MTATPQAPARPVDPARSLDRTPAQVWRRLRAPFAVLALVLLAGIGLALAGGTSAGYLDPRAADPSGSRAVAELLRDQGVRVELATTATQVRDLAGPDATVVVAKPDLAVGARADAVRASGADLVLLGAHAPESFVEGVQAVAATDTGTRQPGCRLPAATRAGAADAGGIAYQIAGRGADADLCYSADGRPSLLQVRPADDGDRTVTLVGNPEPFTNGALDEEGNAALALNLLGTHGVLVWYLPSLSDIPTGEARSPYELVPDGVWWGLAQVAVAVLLLALWRARRLGPVVVEPLPVVIRATETVEGRARLYRRSGARDRAAEALRSGARSRLVPMLGVPRGGGPDAVVPAVAARSRRSGAEVHGLLYGAPPPDDAALVRLADDLDTLEDEVRRS